jgi:hypothetical protein
MAHTPRGVLRVNGVLWCSCVGGPSPPTPIVCLSVQLAPPMHLVTFVAEAGGVAEATLMAPWRRDWDRSPFCEEWQMWGI